MTISVADRVFQTSTTAGTATYQLAAGPAGFIGFVAGVGSGKKVGYIADDGTNWECGIGTVTAGSPDTLTRTTVLSSSNSGALVNWGAGTRNIRLAPLAKLLVHRDENLADVEGFGTSGGTANAHTVTTYPGILAYSDGMKIRYFAPAGNTGSVTVNVDGRGAKGLRYKGANLASGAVPSGTLVEAVYKSASGWFEMSNNPQIAFDELSPTTTKGDLIVDNGTVPVRVPVGSNGDVLVADSAQAAGVNWATITTPWVAYTPTFTGFGTVSGVTARSRRVGQNLEWEIDFVSGTPTAVEARVSIGFNGTDGNVSTAADYPNSTNNAGFAGLSTNGSPFLMVLVERSVNYMTFSYTAAGVNLLGKTAGSSVWSGGARTSIKGSARIQGW